MCCGTWRTEVPPVTPTQVHFMFTIRPRFSAFRSLASLSPSQINAATQSPFQVFDRQAKRLQKDRAAARDGGNRSRMVDYVRDEVANRMIERFMAGIYPAEFS